MPRTLRCFCRHLTPRPAALTGMAPNPNFVDEVCWGLLEWP
jgi:hypothetical protein